MVDTHARTVDHAHIAAISICNCIHNPIPYARFGPATEAIVAGGVGAIAFRQIAPRRARSQHPENAIQHSPVIHPCNPTGLVRQQRGNHPPLKLGQMTTAHTRPPSGSMESGPRDRGKPVYEFTAKTSPAATTPSWLLANIPTNGNLAISEGSKKLISPGRALRLSRFQLRRRHSTLGGKRPLAFERQAV